jgi:hypothetical protein
MAPEPSPTDNPQALHTLPAECLRAIAADAGILGLRALAEASKPLSQSCREIGIINCRRCNQLWLDSERPAHTCAFLGCSGWPCAADRTRYLAER